MGKSKDLATGASADYVGTSGDTMTGNLQIDSSIPSIYLGSGQYGTSYIEQYPNDLFIYNTASNGSIYFGTNNTQAMSIDPSRNVDFTGRVTMPYQPFMFMAANPYTTANNANLQFHLTRQSRNLSWNTSTHSFTVPVSGVYTFSITTRLATTALHYMYHMLKVNGSNYPDGSALMLQKPNTADTFQTINTTMQAHLTANDSVSISINYNGSGSYTVNSQSWFSVALIG